MSRAARLSFLAALALSAPAWAETPLILGVSQNWAAYQATTNDGKVCYAVAQPASSVPAKASRDAVFLLISVWPGRNVQDEVELVPGYPYRDSEPVVAEVGAQKAEFFTRNEGNAGVAWVKDAGAEVALVAAMRGGTELTVKGVSKRGTHTTDTYSLAGLGPALDTIHTACGAK